MNSPISDFIVETVKQKLEETVLLDNKQKLWLPYVDGTLVIIKRSELQRTFTVISGVLTEIKSIMEAENDNSIPFLDMCDTRANMGLVATSVFQ